MKTLFIFVSFLSLQAVADCPYEISVDQQNYCVSSDWGLAEKRSAGTFQETQQMSPFLIKKGTLGSQWLFSKIQFKVWRKGDELKTPTSILGWRVFPYMEMLGGHHHGASSKFSWNAESQTYTLSQVALTQMEGCWSLRWTTSQTEEKSTSQKLMNIEAFSNLNPEELVQVETLCSLCAQEENESNGDHTGHRLD